MTRPDHAAEVRNALVDPRHVCEFLGLEIGRQRQPDGGVWILCPWHGDKGPSCSVTIGPAGTLRVHCFACNGGGSVLDLIAAARALDIERDFRRVLEEGASLAGIRLDDASPMPQRRAPAARPPRPVEPPPLADATFAAVAAPLLHCGRLDALSIARDVTRYLDGRGLLGAALADGWAALPPAGETQAAWCRVLADNFDGAELRHAGLFREASGALTFAWTEHRLVIPWRSPAGEVYTLQRRRLGAGEPKYVFPPGRAPRWPYGIEQLAAVPPTTPVAFVEGAVDALALCELDVVAGVQRLVLGVPGVRAWRKDTGPAWAALARGRVAYVAVDADAAGADVVRDWAADLYAAGATKVLRLEPAHVKDWAEELVLVHRQEALAS